MWLCWVVFVMLIVVVQLVWVLCCLVDGGVDLFIELIGGVVLYLMDVLDGYVIWVLLLCMMMGYCYKDYGGVVLNFVEQVYFYVNLRLQDFVVWGFEIGICYGGCDYFGLGSGLGVCVEIIIIVGMCLQWNFDWGLCLKVLFSIIYQVVVCKKG